MKRFRAVTFVALGVLLVASVALAMKEQPRPLEPPDYAVGRLPVSGPFVLFQQGDTTWVTVHTSEDYCPGDTVYGGHGGEAEGGPTGAETWCFEAATYVEDPDPTKNGELVTTSDSCGTQSPYTYLCWDHVDVRTLPSQTGINFWHLDSYRTFGGTGGPDYTGTYCLWCGSDSLWIDGQPVECGTWTPGKFPGYGNQWNCIVEVQPRNMSSANGCTLYFDPRYDTECKYDYLYLDYHDGSEWVTAATFNASSNNPGDRCGDPSSVNPDWYDNTDTGQPNSANWQQRIDPNLPTHYLEKAAGEISDPPRYRWRFYTDGAWSDMDGRGDTDGGAFIDNVWVYGSRQYQEDFEDNDYDTLDARGWVFADPDPVAQFWHQEHDADPPYEGGDGGIQTTCTLDSSLQWRGRPKQGYKAAWPNRNAWFYRLLSPAVPIQNTGCVWHYDQFMCALEYTCDYTDTKVRFYDSAWGKWCPWINLDGFILYGGCFFWNFDDEDNVTQFYGPTADSVMFGWDLMDVSTPDDFCRGKHKNTENVVDNVSCGFFDGNATIFTARVIDILQDTYHDSICAYNSFFDAYELDTLRHYHGPPYVPTIPKGQQLYVEITDKDNVADVRLYGSYTEGAAWVYNTMTKAKSTDPQNPALGGEHYGNFCPDDFGLALWPKGVEMWYYVRVEDDLGNLEYWPADANPLSEDHTGTREDYFTFSILPMFPPDYTGTKILLVDGYGRRNYDYTECMAADDNIMPLDDIYENTLVDAGYCYDLYDISGAGSNIHLHPLQYTIYDAVVWFTGPYFSNYLFDKEAQIALRAYLNAGGKVVLCGDRIAYNMADPAEDGVGEDSLGGEFLNGIMGCDYLEEMPGGFSEPYIYLQSTDSIYVFGSKIDIELDSMLVYRQCPYLKDMSYMRTSASPDSGYTAQYLAEVLYPKGGHAIVDGAIYVEKPLDGGQCVFVNYDLSGWVTHQASLCDPVTVPEGLPAHQPGYYYGRVDLMRVILEDIFGLTPPFPGGGGGTSDVKPKTQFRWALSQNFPNPAARSTEIRFEVAKTTNVSIKVYNAMGQLVSTLEDGRMQPGRYSVNWDGTNSAGHRVSSGVYFYKMAADKFSATKKMLIVK
jgi:hypothetical protein